MEKDKAVKKAIKLHKQGKSLREIGRITGLGAAQNVKHYITTYAEHTYNESSLIQEIKYLKRALYQAEVLLKKKDNILLEIKEIILR